MKYFLKRVISYLIDCLIAFAAIMLIVQWAILSHVRGSIGITDDWFTSSFNMYLYVLTTISLPVWLYFTYFDSKQSKGTLGKRIFKLSVQEEKYRTRISVSKSFVRAVLKLLPWEIAHLGVIFPTPLYYEEEPEIRLLSYIGLVLLTIYVASIFLSSTKQTIYDRLLGTIVSEDYKLG